MRRGTPISRALPLLLTALALGLPRPAAAQSFSVMEWKLYRSDTGELLDTQVDRDEFFNKANCDCNVPLSIDIRFQGDYLSANYDFQIVAGESCLDNNDKQIREGCQVLYGPVRVNTLATPAVSFTTTTQELMQGSCASTPEKAYKVSMFTNSQNSAEWEQDQSGLDYTVDTEVPDQPRNAKLKAGEGQVTISFDSHTSSTGDVTDAGTTGTVDKDFKGYQVLCETVSGSPAIGSPKEAEYRAAINVCGGTPTTYSDAGAGDGSSGASLPPGPIPRAGDGGVVDSTVADSQPVVVDSGVPADSGVATDSGGSTGNGAASLDDAYVCSSLKSAAGSITVSGLENGASYRFYLVTIDNARNPSEPLLVGEAEPELAEDLWERYKRLGGQAEGGYCFVATAVHGSYDHPHVRVLREFRDRVLMPSALGRRFVYTYYLASPPFADWLTRHEVARAGARVLLWPVTLAASAYLYTSTADKVLVLLTLFLGVGFLVRVRRRRRRTGGGQ